MNDQRKIIYEQRHEIISSDDVHDIVTDMYDHVNSDIIAESIPEKAFKEKAFEKSTFQKSTFRQKGC